MGTAAFDILSQSGPVLISRSPFPFPFAFSLSFRPSHPPFFLPLSPSYRCGHYCCNAFPFPTTISTTINTITITITITPATSIQTHLFTLNERCVYHQKEAPQPPPPQLL